MSPDIFAHLVLNSFWELMVGFFWQRYFCGLYEFKWFKFCIKDLLWTRICNEWFQNVIYSKSSFHCSDRIEKISSLSSILLKWWCYSWMHSKHKFYSFVKILWRVQTSVARERQTRERSFFDFYTQFELRYPLGILQFTISTKKS